MCIILVVLFLLWNPDSYIQKKILVLIFKQITLLLKNYWILKRTDIPLFAEKLSYVLKILRTKWVLTRSSRNNKVKVMSLSCL